MQTLERKLIHIVLSPHGDQDRKLTVGAFKKAARSIFQKHPKGNVIIFTEEGDYSPQSAERVRQYVADGGIPTKTVIHILNSDNLSQVDSDLLAAEGKSPFLRLYDRIDLIKNKKFDSALYHSVANIVRKKRGRVQLVIEGRDGANTKNFRQEQARRRMVYSNFLNHGYAGDFSAALPYFKEFVGIRTRIQTIRDPNFASQIDAAFQKDTVVGAVGTLGTTHTLLAYLLDKKKDVDGNKKYKVKKIFPEMRDGMLFFTPLQEISRRQIYQPSTPISEDEWRIAMARQLIAVACIPDDLQTQPALKYLWRLTRDMTIEDVNRLETNIQQYGMAQAVEGYQFIIGLTRKKTIYSIFPRK